MQTHTWESVPLERINDDITRRMIVGQNEMIVRWEFRKGGVAARHSHPNEQIVMMVRGRLRLGVGEVELILKEGDIVVVPPHLPHEAEALEDTIVIDIFSPPREDFLTSTTPEYLRG